MEKFSIKGYKHRTTGAREWKLWHYNREYKMVREYIMINGRWC